MMIIGPRQLLDLTTCREQTVIFSLVVFWHIAHQCREDSCNRSKCSNRSIAALVSSC